MNGYLYILGRLRRYFESISQEECSSRPNYVAILRVKRDFIELVADKLKENCDSLKVLESTVFKCSKGRGLLTFLMKSGRLVVEAANEDEAFRILEELFG